MKLSIIFPVLNSHEFVRRQIKYLSKLNLEDVEVLIMDDGSNPPLMTRSKAVKIIPTNDYRQWTQEIARNSGAKIAKGKNLILMDIDHILTQDAIDFCKDFDGDKVNFVRRFGILDENGNVDCTKETIKKAGVRRKWIPRQGLRYVPGHRNNFCMRKQLFWRLGGYKEHLAGKAYPYGGGPDAKWWAKWRLLRRNNRVVDCDYNPLVYFVPNGKYCGNMDADKLNLFHRLSRKSGNFKSYV